MPLGSDISISISELPDLQAFLSKEQVLIFSKQKGMAYLKFNNFNLDLDKESANIQKLSNELGVRIDELSQVVSSSDIDENSSLYIKLSGTTGVHSDCDFA